MSQNNIPDILPSVEKLIQRVNAAEKSNQREVRITIQEARELSADLSVLTAKLGKNIVEIHQMLREIRNQTASISIETDGGTF